MRITSIAVIALVLATVASVDGSVASAEPPKRERPISPLVWVSATVAGAGLVGGTVLGFLVLDAQSKYDKSPSESRAQRGETMAVYADLCFSLAALGALTAVLLYAYGEGADAGADPASKPHDSARVHVLPFVAPTTAGISAEVRF